MEYLAQRLRFEATLRESINPLRLEVLESRHIVMDSGAAGFEWSEENQRSVRIGRAGEPPIHGALPRRKCRVCWLVVAGILLVFAWFLLRRPREPLPESAPPVLRNADFEATDLSLSPRGRTTALMDWQDIFPCPAAELVDVNRYCDGRVFARSGKNAALLRNGSLGCYLTQQLRRSDGSPVKVRDGLVLRLSGWAWIEHPSGNLEISLRVIASGRPSTIQYEACTYPIALGVAGWQRFTADLAIQGDLTREPYWVEPSVPSKPALDLNRRELFLSIDSRSTDPILLDDLKIEEIPGK